ncbi:uncharacterized protein MONBRDRAFT_28254 [Monosiga brevicollis MX1]|uniref:Protein kinase domain-containing protein n=1 Tax=Monosiga brevicollis TaxID=81824 RepID=A9V7M5_MONBE|nr:uncharacterized protein MONBRDRAFT_28254 [Monosiga brevicollis MX1]EDQ86401.1 predicted protein [Monosiga brevicollis MX1]|eukprot:XP_001748791.1 hypothetical protein [Monosiga brevicollis MX1]
MVMVMMRWVVCGLVVVLAPVVVHATGAEDEPPTFAGNVSELTTLAANGTSAPTEEAVSYTGTVGCRLTVPAEVTRVVGDIILLSCDVLTAADLNVFDQLVENNSALTRVDGLEGLANIGGIFNFYNNAALTNVDGIGSLASVGGSLFFYYNEALASVDGFGSLASVGGDLDFFNNSALASVDGLENLTSIAGLLRLANNDVLTRVDGFGKLTSVGDHFIVYYNGALANDIGLRSLASVGGELHFQHNKVLTNVDGLENLASVGGQLFFHYNSALTNVDALGSLTSVGGNLIFYYNSALTNLDGLRRLTSVGEGLFIHYNFALTNVDGLGRLASVGDGLFFHNNSALANVDGLGSLTSVGNQLEFYDNSALTNIDGLVRLTNIGGHLELYDNDALTSIAAFGSLTNVNYSRLVFLDCQQLYGLDLLSPAFWHVELECRIGPSELTKSFFPQFSQLNYLRYSFANAKQSALTSIPYDAWWRSMNTNELKRPGLVIVTPHIQCDGNQSDDALIMIKCSCYNPPYRGAPFCPKPAQNVACPASGSVLSIVQVCNGVDDCSNGEDEASCYGILKLRSISDNLPYIPELDCINQVELRIQRGVIQSTVPQGVGNHSCFSWHGVMRNWDAAELHFALSSARVLVPERPKPWVVMAVTLRSTSNLSIDVPLRVGYQLVQGSLFGLTGSSAMLGEDTPLPSLTEFDAQYAAQVDSVVATTTIAASTSELTESSTNDSSVVMIVAVAVSVSLLAIITLIAYTLLPGTRRRIERTAMEREILALMHQARAEFTSAYPQLRFVPLELLDSDAIDVEQVIGHGHFSNVYQGSLLDGEQKPRRVAIKECDGDKTMLSAWLREILLLHSLCNQPNIIGLHGVLLRTAEQSTLSAVLEWAPHGNLRDFVQRHPLSEAQLHQALYQTATALACLAKLEIVHRDVAARNVLVMAAGPAFACKLGDFGLSRVMPSSKYYRSVADSEMPFRYDVLNSREPCQQPRSVLMCHDVLFIFVTCTQMDGT